MNIEGSRKISDDERATVQLELDTLKNQTARLMEKAVKQIDLDGNSSALLGNDMYSIQLSSNGNASLSDAIEVALSNRLSIIDADQCLETLKDYYNISDSIDVLIAKSDVNSYLQLENLQKPLTSNSAKISIYHPVTKKELDMSLCENDEFGVKTPIKTADLLNLNEYQVMKDQGIDGFNPNDDSFNSICSTHIDNGTSYDTTVNFRRSNYFQNMSVSCSGSSCNYTNIDVNAYVNCNCTNVQPSSGISNDFVSYFLSPFGTWNFNLATCYNLIIPVIY
jgi:hypothetical protein